MAEEIFQSGILPSDSDFRIFRDFGNIAGELMNHMRWGLITMGFSIGLDMAQVDNGYVYHTAFDTFENVPGRSIQNSGNNVLALVRAYSNASELYNTEVSLTII